MTADSAVRGARHDGVRAAIGTLPHAARARAAWWHAPGTGRRPARAQRRRGVARVGDGGAWWQRIAQWEARGVAKFDMQNSVYFFYNPKRTSPNYLIWQIQRRIWYYSF